MKPTLSADKTLNALQPAEVTDIPKQMEISPTDKSSRFSKKHVLIGVITILAIGLAITCVLVAIRIYTDSQKEIVKYSLTFKDSGNSNVNQTVAVADNSVVYHVVTDDTEAWIIDDFDKNVRVIKVKNHGVACYATPLNRSLAQDPRSVPSTAPETNHTTSIELKYTIMPDVISDIAFLGTKVADACNNVPTYWKVPSCLEGNKRLKRFTIGLNISFKIFGLRVTISASYTF